MRLLVADGYAAKDSPGAQIEGGGPHRGSEGGSGAAAAPVGCDSLASTWRYASVTQSSDSDTYAEPAEAVAGPGLPAAAAAARAVSPPPTATCSPASTPGGTGSGSQLWPSPSKRPQMPQQHQQHQQKHYPYPSAPAAGAFSAPHLPRPPGVDAASYAAGERAAFMMAFQQALPGQQALGQLFTAVDALHSRLEEEARAWRALQLGASKADGLLEACLQRLDKLEHGRLPQLEGKWEETARRAPEQLMELVGSLQQVVSLLAQQRQLLLEQRQGVGPGASSGAKRQLPWLLLAAAGYGQSILSSADVAVLFLSRKILLVDPQQGDQEEGGLPYIARRRQMSSALGAVLFVAAVETAWQAQHRALRPLPVLAQRMAAPLQLGMRVARAAVWSAAMYLAVAHTRASCRYAAGSICGAAESMAAAIRLPTWAQRALPLWRRQPLSLQPLERGSPSCCGEAAGKADPSQGPEEAADGAGEAAC